MLPTPGARRTGCLSLLLILAAVAVAPRAAAQPADPTVQRYSAAKKHYDAGAYAEAYEEFRALAADIGSPNAELYVARCLRALGRLPEAYEAMASALRSASARAAAEPRYVETRDAAAAQLAELEPLVGKLVVAVAEPPPDLVVEVGGTPIPAKRIGVPLAAAVGEAVVRVRAAGKQDIERRVTIRGGEVTTVTVALSPIAPPAAPRPVPPPPSKLGPLRVTGIASLVVGAAGMVTFAVAGTMANQRYATLSTACSPGCSPADVDSGKKLDLGANVGLGVGIAGLVAGAGLVVFGRPATQGVAAWTVPGGVVLGAGGSL